MMRQYIVTIMLYFFYKISIRGSYNLRSIGQIGTKDTRLQRALLDEITEQNQWVDMALIVCLLFTFRPRMWPQFFEMGAPADTAENRNVPRAQLQNVRLPLVTTNGRSEIELKDLRQ